MAPSGLTGRRRSAGLVQLRTDDEDDLDASSIGPAREARCGAGAAQEACCTLRALLICAYIVAWYCCSIGLTIYNKWLFSLYGFRFPIIVTMVHMALKAPFAKLVMLLFGIPPVRFTSASQYLAVCVPVGVATSLDVVLSNASLQFITVTVYTIVKSSVPVWILLFSFALGLLRPSRVLGLTILVISAGIALASMDEDMNGEWTGAALCAGASVCAGVRWALSQLVLQPRAAARGGSGAAPLATWKERPLGRRADGGAAAPARTAAVGAGERPAPWVWPRGESEGLLAPTAAAHAPLPLAAPRSPRLDGAEGAPDAPPLAAERGAAAVAPPPPLSPPRAEIDPIAFLLHMSPWAALTLLPAALGSELGPLLRSRFVRDRAALSEVALLSSVGALIAFFLLLAELLLVRATSGLTLSVAGIFKEVLTICASILLLDETLTTTNAAGLAVALLGVGTYNVLMLRQRMSEARTGGGQSGAARESAADDTEREGAASAELVGSAGVGAGARGGSAGDEERGSLELAGGGR